MSFVRLRNVDHYYEWITDRGSDRTENPVMVFVHGWGGSARYWEETARFLAPWFDCLLYDLRGFGRSRDLGDATRSRKEMLQSDYSVRNYAEDLVELLGYFELDKIWLHAHSMGTSIATVFLAEHGDRVERAIFACGGVFKYEKLAFALFHRFGGYVVRLRPAWLRKIPFANRMFMARFLHKALPDDESQAFLEDYLMADNDAALGTLYSAVSQEAAEEMPGYFAAINRPTLLLSGEHDIIIPADLGANAAELNPGSIHYQVLAGTAHFPMLEDRETYKQIVSQFIETPIAHLSTLASAAESQANGSSPVGSTDVTSNRASFAG